MFVCHDIWHFDIYAGKSPFLRFFRILASSGLSSHVRGGTVQLSDLRHIEITLFIGEMTDGLPPLVDRK